MTPLKLRKLYESALEVRYPMVTISEITALPTNSYDEKINEWVPDSFSIFIILKKMEADYSDSEYDYLGDAGSFKGISSFLEGLIGFECCVDIISNQK